MLLMEWSSPDPSGPSSFVLLLSGPFLFHGFLAHVQQLPLSNHMNIFEDAFFCLSCVTSEDALLQNGAEHLAPAVPP